MRRLTTLLLGLLIFFTSSLYAQDKNQAPAIPWKAGPITGSLKNFAEIRIPANYVFGDANDARTLLEITNNPPTGNEVGAVAPTDADWWVLFTFNESGYVSDDEKDSLDADAILSSIRSGTEASNKERVKRGWDPLTIVGWQMRPNYNEFTHNLEWAIKGVSKGDPLINYNERSGTPALCRAVLSLRRSRSKC